jgi:hypothetical protein
VASYPEEQECVKNQKPLFQLVNIVRDNIERCPEQFPGLRNIDKYFTREKYKQDQDAELQKYNGQK